jgi:DNA modification methylase
MDKLNKETQKKETQVTTNFDYEVLELEQRLVVQQRTGEIKERLRRSAQDIWEIGQKLAEVRSQLGHGPFDMWLKAEFNWSRRTAYNFISVYETFGTRANLAQLDIATSALYLLAAPSTPKKVREEYLQRAEEGEKITHKDLQDTIQKEKSQPAPTSTESSQQSAIKPEIVSVLPKEVVRAEPAVARAQTSQLRSASYTAPPEIQAGWYHLEKQHLLFCGDTASSQFSDKVPEAAFALAITSDDWDHDWLIDRAKSVTILPESELEEPIIEQLLSIFSQKGESVIFPWLPSQNLIAIAHQLNRRVFAGDSDPERCREAIAHSGLRTERIN